MLSLYHGSPDQITAAAVNSVGMSKRKLASLFIFIVCIAELSCSKKGKDVPPPVVPSLSIANASADRTTTGSVMHFNLSLNKTTRFLLQLIIHLLTAAPRLQLIIPAWQEP